MTRCGDPYLRSCICTFNLHEHQEKHVTSSEYRVSRYITEAYLLTTYLLQFEAAPFRFHDLDLGCDSRLRKIMLDGH